MAISIFRNLKAWDDNPVCNFQLLKGTELNGYLTVISCRVHSSLLKVVRKDAPVLFSELPLADARFVPENKGMGLPGISMHFLFDVIRLGGFMLPKGCKVCHSGRLS